MQLDERVLRAEGTAEAKVWQWRNPGPTWEVESKVSWLELQFPRDPAGASLVPVVWSQGGRRVCVHACVFVCVCVSVHK